MATYTVKGADGAETTLVADQYQEDGAGDLVFSNADGTEVGRFATGQWDDVVEAEAPAAPAETPPAAPEPPPVAPDTSAETPAPDTGTPVPSEPETDASSPDQGPTPSAG